MTSSRRSYTESTRSVCTTAGCERPALVSASVCRTHIVDILRAEGEWLMIALCLAG